MNSALLAFSEDATSVNQFQTSLAERPCFRFGAQTSKSTSSLKTILKSNMATWSAAGRVVRESHHYRKIKPNRTRFGRSQAVGF
uniref:Uncharacterized protein n=1 Tax=Hyaloperonospora arabidopsidis (strain Emoy2) TaxID=559515 RepID=M4C220_HYAAE